MTRRTEEPSRTRTARENAHARRLTKSTRNSALRHTNVFRVSYTRRTRRLTPSDGPRVVPSGLVRSTAIPGGEGGATCARGGAFRQQSNADPPLPQIYVCQRIGTKKPYVLRFQTSPENRILGLYVLLITCVGSNYCLFVRTMNFTRHPLVVAPAGSTPFPPLPAGHELRSRDFYRVRRPYYVVIHVR